MWIGRDEHTVLWRYQALLGNCVKYWWQCRLYPPPPTHPTLSRSDQEMSSIVSSVLDPDSYVFGPHGSGSVSTMYGSWSFYHQAKIVRKTSVADPDPGSGAFLTPGSGIRNRIFPDPGSQIHIFESLVTIFWVKSSIILWKLAQIFSSPLQN